MIDLDDITPLDPELTDGVRVLIAEDDPDVRELLQVTVEVLGLETLSVDSGDAAIERVREGGVHLVLTDLLMPGANGDEVCRAVRRINPSIPVLVLTAIDDVDRAVSLMKAGASDYLTKPVPPTVLGARLSTALRLPRSRERAEELSELIDRSLEARGDFQWGNSRAMLDILAKLPRLARTKAPILIQGESGTGKEHIAQSIHYTSRRRAGPMISVNCGATPESLWEREFFGHTKGAFSDAGGGASGLIAEAEGGTLFLDEVGEIPLKQQAKLLRFLQEGEYRPVGSTKVIKANVRVISATNRDLKADAEQGSFRRDLFFRLNVISIKVPPLAERRQDIASLAGHFVSKYAEEFEREIDGLSPRALAKLCSYDYPGNVRELQNIIQQAVAETASRVITAERIPVGDPTMVELGAPPDPGAPPKSPIELDQPYNDAKAAVIAEFERVYVAHQLDAHDGHIGRAAEAAGISRRSFSRVMSRRRDDGPGEDADETSP